MLTRHLENCNRFITLDPVDRSVFASHYDLIRKTVIDAMKETDELFKEIFCRTELSGSYADQLKISKPDEYDVLMILKLPRTAVEKLPKKPGYVQIRTTQDRQWYGIGRKIIDSDGYLMQNRVLEWLRRIMKTIFPNQCNKLKIGRNQYIVSHKDNGPANTLNIQCEGHPDGNNKFSIDFVGALEFSVAEEWVADDDTPRQWFLKGYWNAVPKPRKPTRKPFYSQRQPQYVDPNTLRNRRIRNLNRNRSWICSYAQIERELIHDFQFIKPLIRIFKKIRDTQNLANLKSYYIKQIFIRERMHQHQDPNYWEQSLGDLFMAMLDVIIECLKSRCLPFYWHKEYNLLNFNREQIADLENKFRRIRYNICKPGSNYIYEVILTDDEQRHIHRFA